MILSLHGHQMRHKLWTWRDQLVLGFSPLINQLVFSMEFSLHWVANQGENSPNNSSRLKRIPPTWMISSKKRECQIGLGETARQFFRSAFRGKKTRKNSAKNRLKWQAKRRPFKNTENLRPLRCFRRSLLLKLVKRTSVYAARILVQQKFTEKKKRYPRKRNIIIHDPRLGFFGEISKKVAPSRDGSQWILIVGMLTEAHAKWPA